MLLKSCFFDVVIAKQPVKHIYTYRFYTVGSIVQQLFMYIKIHENDGVYIKFWPLVQFMINWSKIHSFKIPQ